MIERYKVSQDDLDSALQHLGAAKDMPPASGVYVMVNVPTGRMYVGRSKNMRHRCGVHLSEMRSGIKDIRMQRDFAEYGEDAMRFAVVVERCDELELVWCELQAMQHAYSRDCYNKLAPNRCMQDPAQDFIVRQRLKLTAEVRGIYLPQAQHAHIKRLAALLGKPTEPPKEQP